MNSIKKEIIKYTEDLINTIDIQCEEFLAKQSSYKSSFDVDKARLKWIEKVKQIENLNLSTLTSDTKFAFENKFCFFVQNEDTSVHNKSLECFNNASIINNPIGVLVVLGEFLNNFLVSILSNFFNGKHEPKAHTFDYMQDLIKYNVIYGILENIESIQRDEILDLSDHENNRLSKLKIMTFKLSQIRKSDFEFIPKYIDIKTIEKIKLIFKDLKITDPATFSVFKNLTCLEICNNFQLKITTHFFFGLDNLKSLSIRRVKVEKSIFTGLKTLKNLDLSYNEFKDFEPNLFTDLDFLESLDLSANRIKSINKHTFQGLINLKYLCLDSNNLEYLESHSFSYLTNLAVLTMDSGLQDPILNINPSAFEPLVNLKILIISRLTDSNCESLKTLKSLTMLCVKFHSLDKLDFLNSLENLEYLDLVGSNIEIVNINKVSFKNLRYFSFDCENVTRFESGFEELRGLAIKGVCSLEKGCFSGLDKLNFLKISVSKCFSLDNLESFQDLKNFKYFRIEIPECDNMKSKIDLFLEKIPISFESPQEIQKNVSKSENNQTFAEIICFDEENLEEILEISKDIQVLMEKFFDENKKAYEFE